MISKSKLNNLTTSLCLLITPLLYSTNAFSTTYYIDNGTGSDKNSGTTIDSAWKSLNTVNDHHFSAGDKILFKRGQKWRGTLEVNNSGESNRSISYSSYGKGDRPVIMRTVEYSDWKLINTKNKKTIKIWSGRIKNLRNSWGMIKDGLRTPSLRQYGKNSINTLPNGYYYAPLNKGVFYYRSDEGNPGKVEIGAKKNAILIEDKNHIIIDGIDTFGPGGRHSNGSATGFRSINISGKSSHILIKNITVSHSEGIAIAAKFNTNNITYSNITSHSNGGTGIYMNSKGGKILNCKSYDNGRLITDKGDRGGIGSYKGSNLLIKHNEVYHNGPDKGYADFEISMVDTGSVIIEKNHIHDCIQGCLQIAEGGDNSIIAYNIISHYGTALGKGPSPGIYSGIRIGGGIGGAKNVRIINNVIHGGKQAANSKEAALYIGWYDSPNLLVQNNIFSQNINKNIYIRGNAGIEGSIFSNNLYDNFNSDIGINFKEKHITNLPQWQKETSYGKNSYIAPALFVNQSDFKLSADFKLKEKSIALNNGYPTGQKSDFIGTIITDEKLPDIGAFQHNNNPL